jgi:hypothetical protein
MLEEAPRRPPRDWTLHKLIYESEDPKAAAKELLRAARQRGIDIDMRTNVDSAPIMFPSGPFYPQDGNTAFVNEMRERAATSPEEESVIVFYCDRSATLREIAGIMDMGVRLLHHFGRGRVALVRPGMVADLCQLPFVTWVGRFEARYKYREDDLRDGVLMARVHMLYEPSHAPGEDIQHAGGRVLRHVEKDMWNYYVVEARSDAIRALAELDWVRSIDWRAPPADRE